MSRQKKVKVVEELEDLLDKYEKSFFENISPSRNNDEIFICGYFMSSIEYARGICSLINADNFVSIEPLFRSLLETTVDISNLCNHKDYYLYLRREQLKREKSRFEKWHSDNENEFFPNPDQIDESYIEGIRKAKDEIKQIDKNGFSFIGKSNQSLNISEKFKLAELEKVHGSIWDLVSSAIHNDLSNISKRHIIEAENGEILIAKRGKLNIHNFSAHLLTIPGLIYSVIGEIFERFEIDKKEIEEIYLNKKNVLNELLDNEISDDNY